jgi:hypothetical protein
MGRFFGEPLPIHPPTFHPPTPPEKARQLADLLLYYARVYETGDEAQRYVAAAFIHDTWMGTQPKVPHVMFMRFVFEEASQADLALSGGTRDAAEKIKVRLSIHYPKQAAKLDPELIRAALLSARTDGRSRKGLPTKWKALAAAWETTGEGKTWKTLKAAWFEELRILRVGLAKMRNR